MKKIILVLLLTSTPAMAGDEGYTEMDRMRDQQFQFEQQVQAERLLRLQQLQQFQQYQQQHPSSPPRDDGYRDCYGC